MHLNRTAVASWLIAVTPVRAAIPAHTTFEIRLLTQISSYYSKPGDEVRGVVVEAVCVGSGSFFPAGTVVRGIVMSVHRVGLGIIHETAKIVLQFREARLADGRTVPVAARLISVDNARERVDSKGAIRGIRATATLSNRIGERLALAAMGHPIALIPILAVESALFRFPDPEIDYRLGTDLHLELDGPLSLPPTAACVDRISQLDQSQELQNIVAQVPYWTYTTRQHNAMDPTNLMFIGSEQSLNRAFESAGWTGARSYSPAADLKIVRAMAEDHADRDAPMRTLLLDDRQPDMYRQKALNTFEKRHHIRLWKRPEQWDGATVWAASATWDIATTFSFRYGFTHRVQEDADLERDKVVGDLAFTGCVDKVVYVYRPEHPGISEPKRKRALWTDGRVAVVALNSCTSPAQAPEPSVEYGKPPLSVRCVRRVTLTARNHFLRDNLVWRGGEGIYVAYRALRDWRQQRTASRIAAGEGTPAPPSMPAGGGCELNGALGLILGM